MGSGASSAEAVDAPTAVHETSIEISRLLSTKRNADYQHAVCLAKSVSDHFSALERALHERKISPEVALSTCISYVQVTEQCFEDSSVERLQAINMLALLLLTHESNLSQAETVIFKAVNDMSATVRGRNEPKLSLAFAVSLMNLYSFYKEHSADVESNLAKDQCAAWIISNCRNRSGGRGTAFKKNLTDRVQNLLAAYKDRPKHRGCRILTLQASEILEMKTEHGVAERKMDDVGNEIWERLSGKMPSPVTSPNCNRDTKDIGNKVRNRLSAGAMSPSSSSNGDNGTGQTCYSPALPLHRILSKANAAVNQTAALLVEIIPFAFADESGKTATAVRETLRDCVQDGTILDVLIWKEHTTENTILMRACQDANAKTVRLILEEASKCSTSINIIAQLMGARNAKNWTPLHFACHSTVNSYPMVDTLLKYGSHISHAMVHSADSDGCTPLHFAAASGSTSIAALLLMYHASIWQKDKRGFMAVDYCSPDDHNTIRLLYTPPLEQSNAVTSDKDAWEKRVDLGSGKTYFFNLDTGEVALLNPLEEQKVPHLQRDIATLMSVWRSTAWRIGIQGLLARRKEHMRQVKQAYLKSKAHLLDAGKQERKSLLEKLRMREDETKGLRDKLDAAIEESANLKQLENHLNKERAKRKRAQKRIKRVGEDLQGALDQLHAEQASRQRVADELSAVNGKLAEVEHALARESKLSAVQTHRVSELSEERDSLEEQMRLRSNEIERLTARLARTGQSAALTKEQLEEVRRELFEEQQARKAAQFTLENAREQFSKKFWTLQSTVDKEKMDAKKLRKKLEKQRRECAASKDKLERIRRELEDHQNLLADKSVLLSLTASEKEQANQRTEELKEKERNLRSALDEKSSLVAQLMEQCRLVELARDNALAEVTASKKRLKKAKWDLIILIRVFEMSETLRKSKKPN